MDSDWARTSLSSLSFSSSSGQRQNQPPRPPPRSFPPYQSRQQRKQLKFYQAEANRTQTADKNRLERIEREIEKRHKDDVLKIRIHPDANMAVNMIANMTALELRREMERYGDVGEIIIEPESALVFFEARPHNIRDLVRLNIGGHRLRLELLRNHPDSRFSAESLELGAMLAEDVFCSEFMVKSAVTIHFQENKRQIKITFKHPFNETIMKYHVEMKFQDMDKGCIQVHQLGSKDEILIQLRFPPIFWRFDSKLEGSDHQKWSVNHSLRRAVDILKGGDITGIAMRDSPVEPNPTNLNAKLGRWIVFRLVIDQRYIGDVESLVDGAKRCNLFKEDSQGIEVRESSRVPRPNMEAFKPLAFEVRYMLDSALSFNYIVEYDLTAEVAEIFCALEPLKASMILEHIIWNRQRIWNLKDYLSKQAAKLKTPVKPRIVPDQCVYLRKASITPTTIYLQPPAIETSNRIIRQYLHVKDYFLRVEFSDEGSSKLWSKDSASNENNAIYNRIFAALTQGIKIGNRTYEFLSFSASQLRENSAWFYCPEGGNPTIESIHNWMGDFSRIKSIPKYAARMGQCFSSTRAIDNLSSEQVHMINDIEYNGHVFSDGCGRISEDLARMIGIELEKESMPSAFQIRLGGSKGVLALYPTLPKKMVQIRPSMEKFTVKHYVLEVIRTSSYISSYLNRQIILLLTHLGVPNEIILDLKNKHMRDLAKLETDDTTAIKVLRQNWDEHGTTKMMVEMVKAGFLQNQDPFIKNLLALFKHQQHEELAKKARILVPDGAYLLGVCDETGDLKEGEIFVQISGSEGSSKRRIIEADCIVVRCPCFHPGDVRVVRAVNRKSLAHLHDVIVFNTKGSRGIPSMCSGGDLDGDDFTVIWDERIVKKVKQHEPMDYSGQGALAAKDVTIHDIKKFFVQYAVSDNLGVIANAHLALSDQLEGGPFHSKCLKLAQLHSDAVDFPKSGIPAQITPDLRAKMYPDFMEKPPEKTYRSARILGQIFRDCSEGLESWVPQDYQQSFNKLLVIDGHEDYLADAYECKEGYDREMNSLKNQYGVKSDLEVVCGFITGIGIITNKRDRDIRKAIQGAYGGIRRKWRKELEEEFYAPDSKVVDPQNLPFLERKASAWYAVCYQDLQPGDPYTFPWVAWDILCTIAHRVRTQQLTEEEDPTRASVSGDDDNESTVIDLLGEEPLENENMRSIQSSALMDIALKRERGKISAEKRDSNLRILQQYTHSQFVTGGLTSRTWRGPQTTPSGTPLTLAVTMQKLTSEEPSSPVETVNSYDMEAPLGAYSPKKCELRPLRSAVTLQTGLQAGVISVEPDVDDKALHEILGY
ncbi:MAG: RNA dependent RNA polymerase-domain-containing protein [Benniella sp.]|nr:MAG: RNA dependent RNA polymerase-domain-containing protein [Benniella sp.]